MDVPRPKRNRVARRWWTALAASAVALALALGFLGFEPAAPEVDLRTLLVDGARRGTFVVAVRGPGTLVPEQIRWITALTAGRVEQRFLRASSTARTSSYPSSPPSGKVRGSASP